MSDILKQLLLQFILILLNAFFAATEIAVISLNEKKVKQKAEDGDKKAIKMLKMIEEPTSFLSTIQVGITLAGFLGSAFAADNFAERLSDFAKNAFNISPAHIGLLNTASVIIITLILSYFTLVLGELVPKRIAMRHKEKLAEHVCGFISFLTAVLKPIIWFLSVSTNGMLRVFGIDPNEKEESVSEEDIVLMLDAGADEGTIKQNDIEYIKNVFKLNTLTAADIMTHRKNVVYISSDATNDEIMEIIRTEGYSRIPIYTDSVDNIVGILYSRDFILKHNEPGFTVEQAIFQPTYVPETTHLDLLLKNMQSMHNHIVIVVDEYGAPSGIVTIEDILEEIVGEIWDEGDEEIINIKKLSENTYQVLCTTPLDDFFEFFELQPDEESDSTTVNGWITEHSEDIPQEGFCFDFENISVKVTKADEVMAKVVCVTVRETVPESTETAEKE